MRTLIPLIILIATIQTGIAQFSCADNVVLHCNDIILESNLDGTNQQQEYCGFDVFEQIANEQIFDLHVPFAMDVHFVLEATPNSELDLNLILLTAECDIDECIEGEVGVTTSGEDFVLGLDAGNYYIVIDGGNFAGGPANSNFILQIDCVDIINSAPCVSNTGPILDCGDTVSGELGVGSGQNNLNSYCSAMNQYGFEDHYTFYNQIYTELEIQAASSEFDVNVFLLNNCDPTDCVAGFNGNNIGNESETIIIPPGTFTIIVDGSTTDAITPQGEYTLSINCLNHELDCDSPIFMACNSSYSGSTEYSGSIQGNTFSWCENEGYVGYEDTYEIVIESAQLVHFVLTRNSGNGEHDIYITEDCVSADCLKDEFGATDYGATPGDEDFNFLFQPGVYYVHVDALDGFGTYTLDVSCSSELDCSKALTIDCGDTVSNTTEMLSVGQTNVMEYCDQEYGPEIGYEQIYRLELTEQQIINIKAFALIGALDVDVFILTDCEDKTSCYTNDQGLIFVGFEPGDEDFTVDLPAGTYYIIVDSRNTQGPFQLSLSCNELDCSNVQTLVPNTLTFRNSSPSIYQNNVAQFSCSQFPTPGNEVVIELTENLGIDNVGVINILPVSDAQPVRDLDLVLLQGPCVVNEFCVMSDNLQDEVDGIGVNYPAGETRGWVVDSKSSGGGEYFLLNYFTQASTNYAGSLLTGSANDARLVDFSVNCSPIVVPNTNNGYDILQNDFVAAIKNQTLDFSYNTTCNSCDAVDHLVFVFVDHNEDGNFEDTELEFFSRDANYNGNITFSQPPHSPGIKTMRIIYMSSDVNNVVNRLSPYDLGNVSYELYGNAVDLPIHFFSNNSLTTCLSYGCGPWMEEIVLNGQIHQSENDYGYGDYTNVCLDVKQGINNFGMVPFAQSTQPEEAGLYRIWIDINSDDIYQANELVYNDAVSNGTENFNVDYTDLGKTTMRVQYFSPCGTPGCTYPNPNPCERYFDGEVQDYAVLLDGELDVLDEDYLKLKIYPNPVTDILNIDFGETNSNGCLLEIFTKEGKSVFSKECNESKFILDTDMLVSGVYILSVKTEVAIMSELFFKY